MECYVARDNHLILMLNIRKKTVLFLFDYVFVLYLIIVLDFFRLEIFLFCGPTKLPIFHFN